MRARATILALACAACVAPKSSPQAAATPEIAFAETRVPASLAGATVQPAIAYATASRAETLDLFLPQHGTKPYPVVVRIHGGALRAGSPRADSQGPAAERIVAAGYALAVVNYRVAPEAPFPAGARDVKAAVRFLRANAAQWDLDGTRFAAWGAGAGGWFAVMLGVTGDQATVFDDASLGNPVVSSAVQAVVAFFPPTDLTLYADNPLEESLFGSWLGGIHRKQPELFRKASPITYCRKTTAPTQFIHGTEDLLVAIDHSRTMHAKLKDIGVKTNLLEMPGESHGWLGNKVKRSTDRMFAFLDEVLKP